MNEKTLWKAVQAEMQIMLSDLNYGMWFSSTYIQSMTDDKLEISCPNTLVKKKLETVYLPMIKESANKVGKRSFEIEFVVEGKPASNSKGAETATEFKEPLFKDIPVTKTVDATHSKAGLNAAYTFENYVMGNTNRLAFAIASSIAENPGKLYNPFFLYAGVGLGKTHLIHAIGNKVLEKNPKLKVIYCTGENFTNELIESIRNSKGNKNYGTDAFRKKYRSVDLLIIDDVQFIAGKDSTQEEFFHTFNDLYMNQKQIVLASDRPPEAFKNLEERITSRFRSGILADIQKPDYELRTAILMSKRDRTGDSFPNEVIGFIAENVVTNIRELEAAYMQVLTYARATGEDLNVETTEKALNDIVKKERTKPVNINGILKAVCNYYSVKLQDIKGKKRNKEVVLPRQVAMYLIYEMTQTPYMSIGELLGGRDHTTVLHGVRKIEGELKGMGGVNNQTRQDVINIKQFIFQN